MVHKCGRLPLALKTLGRVLMGNKNVSEWEELLKSEIWDIDDGNKILPALKLSYYHLPPHLKQLFAYCSLIPKDYVFDKNKLILLWVAEGFLSQSKRKKSMENLGHEYFEELKSRSFFQQSTNDELGYTMHDLINDLATSVAGEFSFRLDGEVDVSDMNEAFDKFRHFSLVGPRSGSCRKLNELQRAKHLRTFLVMSVGLENYGFLDKVLLKLQFLRVLSVVGLNHMYQGSQIITKVPESIGSLKHLRYLNFSYTEITSLPEQLSDLYNLQTLLLHNCYQLSSLPESIAKLINLRHLDVSDTPNLNKMPLGIGGLTILQTLTKVFIEEGNRFRISDLKRLTDLQGRLSIIWLDKVIDPIQAKEANLHQKKGLEVLEMEWSDVFDDSRNETVEYEVLKELRPPPKLKNLKILNNMGMRFPSWVGDPSFEQLTELTLSGCRSTHLRLGHLRSLKKLVVESMNEVKTVGFELPAPTNSFPSLQVLEFNYMQGWQRWSIDSGDNHGTPRSFPRLHEISIKCCPELDEVSIGLIPSLRVLSIRNCSKGVLRSMVGLSSSLVKLEIANIKGLTQLHGEDVMHLRALEHLYVKNCDELKYLWEQESEAFKSLVSLQKLEVRWCKNLTSLTFSAVQEHPSPLTELIVSDCDNIQLQPKPIPAKDFSLSRLKSLDILDCKNLKSFPYEHLSHIFGIPVYTRLSKYGLLLSLWGVAS
ncbi:unnamed protein product [Lactuca virosa]|uniref:NB-ARC domain-containing protein n=1 Tax=Lactuca virosa TaxID=75947 RepID=A0AAU9NS63_9ASTR|nr:unnamed protein product [Lactuca virosa]